MFCVELLREKYGDIEVKKRGFFERLNPKNKKHELVIKYLKNWDNKLWQETEYGVQEITSSVEHDLQASVEGTIPEIASANFSTTQRLTEEQKNQVKYRGQDVVNRLQIRDLSALMDFLGEEFSEDRQKKYYIVIDKLDEGWVDDRIRFQLIRALIETSSDFVDVDNAKVIVALRTDLLDRVYNRTRGPGFQEEKLRGNSLPISWTGNKLIEVLDERIDYLIRDQYTTHKVTYTDILPQKIGKQFMRDYLLERTLMRPRDIIEFLNTCIRYADGQTTITSSIVREAEGTYSRERLRALADEWVGTYSNIIHLADILKNKPEYFRVGDLSLDELTLNAYALTTSSDGKPGLDLEDMQKVGNGLISAEEYKKSVVLTFYRVGLVGLKGPSFTNVSWSQQSYDSSISKAEITDETRVYIQKTFHRILGTRSNNRSSENEL